MGGGHKATTDSSKESLLKTIQGMELDEKVSAMPGAENKGEIAYNQAITKLVDLKQETLKENISVQELQKINEKILQVIQDAKNANSQQKNANDIVVFAGLTFEELPQNVKEYYESLGVTATTTVLEDNIFLNEATFPDGFAIPNSITSIGDNAFQGLTLPDGFTIPSSITSIGKYAFAYITSLPDSFAIPPSVTSIGKGAFSGIQHFPDGFTLPSSVTSIGADVFYATKLPNGFTLPNSITSIGSYAFFATKLPKGFTIPSSVTSIGEYAFSITVLPDGFTIPSSVTSIGEFAFNGTTLPVDFTIPSSVTSIGAAAFTAALLLDGTKIQEPPQPNGNDLTLNSDGTWS